MAAKTGEALSQGIGRGGKLQKLQETLAFVLLVFCKQILAPLTSLNHNYFYIFYIYIVTSATLPLQSLVNHLPCLL